MLESTAQAHSSPHCTGGSPWASSTTVLELVIRSVRWRARRRAAWLAQLRKGEGFADRTPVENDLEACLDDRDTPEREAAWYEKSEGLGPLNTAIAEVERELASDAGAPLTQLGDLFCLRQTEMDLLKVCLAAELDSALARAFGYLQGHPSRSFATGPLAARLFGRSLHSLWNPSEALGIWKFVISGQASPGEPVPLSVDPLVIDWLLGESGIDPTLMGLVSLVQPKAPPAGWPVEAAAGRIRRAIQAGSAVRVIVSGPPASGRKTFAASVSEGYGMQTLAIDDSDISDAEWPEIYLRAQRMAILGGTSLAWHGKNLHRRRPVSVEPVPIQFVACEPEQEVAPCDRAVDHRIDLPSLTIEERRKLWKTNIPESAAWPVQELERLATRYRLNAGDIASVGRYAPVSAAQAGSLAREITRQRLEGLGRLLDCPFQWEDLVVPNRLHQGLEDFAFEARDRAGFWELPNARRLFPRGKGLVALFGGPPGTGKTMAAQVIAADLELDLFCIDLAGVVSKYIGETAKNLSRIFGRAARMNAVLLFDEADALFGKRTEVKDSHDRYANADTSYLLQLLEEYQGMVILASNKKQNIDPAFIRRVRYVFEFPRPDAPSRKKIWGRVIGELIGDQDRLRLAEAIDEVGSNLELSGAQIKNAVLASIFAARRRGQALAVEHLLRGIDRELSKEGRTLGPRELERLKLLR